MKASELRLGNFVYYKNKQYEVYGRISAVEIDLDSESRDEHIPNVLLCKVQGIPLTEELLLKCGFIKISSCNDFKLAIREDLHIITSLSEKINPWVKVLNIEAIHVLYLHQLQNLYHSLTGKELDVKL